MSLPILAGMCLLALALATQVLVFWYHNPAGADFFCFVLSGRAAAMGLNPYTAYEPAIMEGLVTLYPGDSPNMNAPATIPVFQLLSPLDPLAAYNVWRSLSLLPYLLAVYLLARRYEAGIVRIAWALALSPLWITVNHGQIVTVLTLLATLAWLAMEDNRPVLAGLCIGFLVATKPNFALWPALLLLSGAAVPALVAGATVVVAYAVPALMYGPSIFWQWMAAARTWSDFAHLGSNMSLPATLGRVGMEPVGLILTALVGLTLAAYAWRGRPDVLTTSAVALAASILLSPIAWPSYLLVLVPAFLRMPRWPVPVALVAALMAVPALWLSLVGDAIGWSPDVGPIYTVSLLVILVAGARSISMQPIGKVGVALGGVHL